MAFSLIPEIETIPHIKPMYNVGALLDILTGTYVLGKYGESILNGGLGAITGFTGIGNNFKTTVMRYLSLTVLGRYIGTALNSYDTETNVDLRGQARLVTGNRSLNGEDVIASRRWTITDKSRYHGNEWFEWWKGYCNNKVKHAKDLMVTTPFLDAKGTGLYQIITPTMADVDSFTEFQTEDVYEMTEKNEIGESGGNTIHMRQGLAKVRFLSEIPREIARSNSPMMMTAHIGKEVIMDPKAPPNRKLEYLKNGDKIKGVTDKFFFLTTQCWQCARAQALLTNDKVPEYPLNAEDDARGDTDLNEVTLTLLRNKNGPSGVSIKLVVTQSGGVHPELTEFHYIKTNDRYGISGNLQWYFLDLLPDVKISRSTVRAKIESNAQLRRALNITAELCEMTNLWRSKEMSELICTPKELYEDLRAMGYDWDVLLNTRGWWTFDNDTHPIKFLSTMDLLRMRKGLYHPYWMAPLSSNKTAAQILESVKALPITLPEMPTSSQKKTRLEEKPSPVLEVL